MSQPHRIRRQYWQASAPDPATAFALRKALREEQERSLLPALAAAFDAAGSGEAVVRIPRLELSLRLADLTRLADELPGQLEAAARRALLGLLAGENRAAEGPGVVSPAERLRHYLRKGSLPWFEAAGEPAELRRMLGEAAGAWAALPDAGWAEWRACLPEDAASAFATAMRYLHLLDPPARRALLNIALREKGMAGRPAAWRAELARLDGRPEVERRLQAACLLLAAGRSWPAEAGPLPAALAGMLPVGEMRRRTEMVAEAGEIGRAPMLPEGAPKQAAVPGGNDGVRGMLVNDSKADSAVAPAWPVHSAGLVLLHPFLPQLFAELKLSAGDGRLPAPALPRAAALLHWLATGEAAPGEFVLGLIKPLLGLHPDDPLPVGEDDLAAGDLAEGEALLAAVVEHWIALRNTSIAALRLSFLQRRGLLRPAPGGWALHPDGESFDLLLGQLPWSISIVRLPWMSAPIFAEWPIP
jgi:hypothetical protein